MITRTVPFFVLLIGICAGCCTTINHVELQNTENAQTFFRGVYGGDPSVVSELAAKNIVISYPIFQELFDSPVIAGKQAVSGFVERFGRKWQDPVITIEKTISDGNSVVLIWSFEARDALQNQGSQSDASVREAWGGITVYQFDDQGRVLSEFGEESDPGPMGRLQKVKIPSSPDEIKE